jgi:hypothetical protein
LRGIRNLGVHEWDHGSRRAPGGDQTQKWGRHPCGGALNARVTCTSAPERPGAVGLESLRSTLV